MDDVHQPYSANVAYPIASSQQTLQLQKCENHTNTLAHTALLGRYYHFNQMPVVRFGLTKQLATIHTKEGTTILNLLCQEGRKRLNVDNHTTIIGKGCATLLYNIMYIIIIMIMNIIMKFPCTSLFLLIFRLVLRRNRCKQSYKVHLG